MGNKDIIATDGAHIKVMNSYDFGHFEITLGLSGEVTAEIVDDARKDAQRLVDKAIDQYKKAKKYYADCLQVGRHIDRIKREVEAISHIPDTDRTPDQKAMIKALNDHLFFSSREYDYQEDWDDCDPEYYFDDRYV